MLRRLCGLGALGAVLVTAADARARPSTLEMEGGLQAAFLRMNSVPALNLPEGAGSTSLRSFSTTTPAGDAALGLAGVQADGALVFSGRYRFVLTGFALYGAVGPSARVMGTMDGSAAEVRPWTTWRADVLLPGFDVRFTHRRWLFAMGARTGIGILTMRGAIVSGATKEEIDPVPYAYSFVLRGSGEVCRRLDPVQRACVVVAPSVYDFGWLNGAQVALRWEVGP